MSGGVVRGMSWPVKNVFVLAKTVFLKYSVMT